MRKFYLWMLLLSFSSWLSAQAWSENFDASTTLPNGWTVINDGDSKEWDVNTFSSYALSPSNSVSIKYSYGTAHDDYLITPKTLIGDDNSTLIVNAKNRSSSDAEDFNILVSTSGKEASDFVHEIAMDVTPGESYETYSYDLSAYDGQDIYIAFYIETIGLWEIYLDDISLSNAPIDDGNGVDDVVIDCASPLLNEIYCYADNENWYKLYTNNTNQSLQISFVSGDIEGGYSGTYDDLLIYDGVDNTGILILDSNELDGTSNRSLAGITLLAESGSLYIAFTSDGSNSCESSSTNYQWEYSILCANDVIDPIDTDGDGVNDEIDDEINSPCPNDVDTDGVSNDDDNDGVANCLDQEDDSPCPNDVDANGVSNDDDNDGVPNCDDGNNGDADTDGDGVNDDVDNCVSTYNPNQADGNGDGLGDACEDCGNPYMIELERTSGVTAVFSAGNSVWHYQGTANRAGRPLRPYPIYGMTDMQNGYIQDDLIPQFDYDIWIRTICNDNTFSEWVGPILLPKYVMNGAETSSIFVVPNPAIDVVTIFNVVANTIQIYDGNGRLIKSGIAENNTLDLSNLSSGQYYLQIVDNDGKTHYTKLIKK